VLLLLLLLCSSFPKVADLKYNTLANGHGPILRYNVEQLVTNYRDWSMAVEKGTTQVGSGS
jgi:flavorubredoxin